MSAVSQAFTAADPLNGAGPRYGVYNRNVRSNGRFTRSILSTDQALTLDQFHCSGISTSPRRTGFR
jgi:hypothetical protein